MSEQQNSDTQVESQVETQNDAQIQAEARAGFDSVNNGGVPPTTAPATATQGGAETATKPEPTADELAALVSDQADPFAGYSKEQIDALLAKVPDVDRLAKMLDQAHGKIGDLNRKLEELKTAKPGAEHAAIPADDDEFARDYPEFAAYTQKQLQKVTAAGAKAGLSPEEVDARVEAKTAEMREEFEIERLTDTHPDWKDVVNQNGYKVWLGMQPAEVQQTAETTVSGKQLSKIIADYKQFTTGSGRNRARLEASLTPSGVAQRTTPAPTATDEARAGFASVMNR